MLFTLSSKLKLHAKHKAQKFDEVQKMIGDMVTIENKEQDNDDTEKPWCNGEFDKSSREKKAENTEIASLLAEIEEEADTMATLADEIKTLTEEIAALDKAVAQATEQRKG